MQLALYVLLIGMILVSFVYFIKEGIIMFSFTKWIRGLQSKIVNNWFENQEKMNFPQFVPESTHFTGAEKQFLQCLLAAGINELEAHRVRTLWFAQQFQKDGFLEEAADCFKHHRKLKAGMKKLVALQTKVKHTLETRG